MKTPSIPFEHYLRLPFEVHYSDSLAYYQYEFMSDADPEAFRDITVVHEQSGQVSAAKFLCRKNTGAELVCCILNRHDEVRPSWLELLEDESMDLSYGTYYKVAIEENEVYFDEFDNSDEDPDSEDFIDTDVLNYCSCESMGEYGIGDTTPDYLVLDCENTRVKVDLDGYVLDDEDEPTECRLFDPDELGEREEYQEYETRELFEAKYDWVKRVLSASFPRETKLYLAER